MFFPIGHEQRVQRFPYVTVALIALNFIVFLYSCSAMQKDTQRLTMRAHEIVKQIMEIDPYYLDRKQMERMEKQPYGDQVKELEFVQQMKKRADELELTDEQKDEIAKLEFELEHLQYQSFYGRWGFVPALWKPITMITHAFLHGGWFHIIGNMLFLWVFGSALEDKWGPYFYSAFYLFGAVAASTFFGLMESGSSIPMIGASGAIFALCGAFMLRFWNIKVIMGWAIMIFFYIRAGKFLVKAWVVMLFYFLENLFYLFVYQDTPGGGVAFAAHIGGFIFGFAVALAMGKFGLEDKYLKAKYDLDGEEHIIPHEYQNALEQIGKGDLDNALLNLQATLAKEPGYLPALNEIFKIYVARKEQDGAVDMATKVVDGYLKLNETPHAVDVYYRLIKEFPGSSMKIAIQFRMADALIKMGHFQEAAVAYRDLALKNPGTLMAQKALLMCGNILTDKVGDHKNSMNTFRYLAKTYPQTEFMEHAKQGYERARQAAQAAAGEQNT